MKTKEELRQYRAEVMRRYRERHPNYSHDYYFKTKESRRATRKAHTDAWRRRNPKRTSANVTAKRLGIFIEEVMRLWTLPCEICGKFEDKMQIDHDHKTGKIRGVLCRWHNTLVGFLEREGKEKILQILEWLEKKK
jgi:hypothetical protein